MSRNHQHGGLARNIGKSAVEQKINPIRLLLQQDDIFLERNREKSLFHSDL